MQVIEAIRQAQALDSRGQLAYVLLPGLQYAMADAEALAGVRDGALKPVGPLEGFLPRYQGQPLRNHKVVLMFTGGQGDAVIVHTCLKSLKAQYPEVTIDVCTPRSNHDIFGLLGGFTILPYPLGASELHQYAYHLTLEKLELFAGTVEYGKHVGSVTNLELFSRCLSTPLVRAVQPLELSAETLQPWDIGQANHRRVGIALTKVGLMRAYPIDLALELATELIERRVAVVVFGRGNEIDRPIPHSPPWIFSLVDKTPHVECLAALISQLDAMVCPDTLFMHLAGVLRVPTLAVFTSSPATVAGGYPTIYPATAGVECSPCRASGEECPQGHANCIVHRHEDLDPAKLAERVMKILQPAAKPAVLTGQSGGSPIE